MREFITERWTHILADSWQHLSLVVQCLILATIIAVVCAALSYQHPRLAALANNVSTVGLTIPSFALVGILIIPFGFGVLPAVIVVTFFATLPILRNAVVGLSEVDSNIVSAARGIGMSRFDTFFRVELPLAWPVIRGRHARVRPNDHGHCCRRRLCAGAWPRRLYFFRPVPTWGRQLFRIRGNRRDCRCHSCTSVRPRTHPAGYVHLFRRASVSNQLTDQIESTDLTSDSGGGAAILLENVTKRYGNNKPAVDQLTLEIPAGKVVMFVGKSGCGKTTTLKLINRLIEPTEGRIFIGGEDASSMNGDKLRRNIGYVIQSGGLLPHLTVGANIAIVPKMLKWDKARIAQRVDELLTMVSLDPETYRDRYPKELSGGQQQRIGVARALAADPPVLLMDEPFGAVDPITRQRLQDELINIQSELGKTIVCVTHDFDEAAKLGDWIAVFDEGAASCNTTPRNASWGSRRRFRGRLHRRRAGLKQLNLARVGDADLITPAFGQPGDDAAVILKEVERLGHDHAVILDNHNRVLSWPSRKQLRRMTTITNYREDDLPVVGLKSSLNDALDTMLVANSGAALVEGPRRKFLGIVNVETVMNAITELRSTTSDEDTPLGNNEGDIPEEVVARVGASDTPDTPATSED